MRRRIALSYMGMVSGFLVLMILNHFLWLEMRVNTALVLPVFTAAGFAASFVYPQKINPGIFFLTQGILIASLLFKYEFDVGVLAIMPAVWLREGFFLHPLDIRVSNSLLVAVICLGNMAYFSSSRHQKRKMKE